MSERIKEVSVHFLRGRYGLMAFINGLVRDEAAAEDIFQEVWVKLVEAVMAGEDIRRPAKWCRGTARNLVLHYWRSKRTGKVVADSSLLDLVERSFDEQDDSEAVWNERRGALAECVKSLPPGSRRLVEMKYLEGLPAADVAGRLGKSAESVLMALSRLRRGLAACVERRLKGAGS